MRTKLFAAFILIIIIALISNIVYERLIIHDFDEFLRGRDEDSIYWILASVEGSYDGESWDLKRLSDALHWGLMLGFESFVKDNSGKQILSSADVLFSMSSRMRSRMEAFLKLPYGEGEFMWYPLFIEGKEIGKLYIRPLQRKGIMPQKEEIFRKRGRQFLIISFLIAGGGSLVVAVLFTIFLSNPIRRLTKASEKIASGDFHVSMPMPHRILKDEIDKLTESFNYMSEALRREDALRRHLASNIVHELRTPLTIIKGNLEAIDDGLISDPRSVLKNIRTEIERIIALIEGIEDLTRAEASFFKKGEPEKLNLREFIYSILQGMRKMIEDKGLFLKAEGDDIEVSTYPDKLHIIVKNLLSNAYKFTERGGIKVKWGRYMYNGFFITIEDTGVGIDDAIKTKVFDRFFKGERSTGKGLGLAIVKELVDVMGGEIELQRSDTGGAKFTIIFKS